jgi:hypothetical protein
MTRFSLPTPSKAAARIRDRGVLLVFPIYFDLSSMAF